MLDFFNALYPAIIIVLIGFLGSIFFYIYLRLLSGGNDAVLSSTLLLGIMLVVPPLIIIELISILLFNKGLMTKIVPEDTFERIVVSISFIPFLMILFLVKPKKVADSFYETLIKGTKQKETKSTVHSLRTNKISGITGTIAVLMTAMKFGKLKYNAILRH